MKHEPEEEHIIQYLLNQLPLSEQTRLEDRYVADSADFERICAVEDSLIEAYLTGALPALRRRQFEEVYFASPVRRTRVEFARNLRETLKLHRSEGVTAERPAGKE